MQSQTVAIVTEAIRYIESHLSAPLGLDQVAAALHYSKYHLHRSFTKTAGITLHDYVSRRRLTEAARLLTDTRRPILDIAFQSGYGSQQAFTDSFRAMYKTTPARFRETEAFYPLQHALRLQECPFRLHLPKENIRPAAPSPSPPTDRADTGYQREYLRLGFLEQELSVEYGYPVQRLTLPPGNISAQNVG